MEPKQAESNSNGGESESITKNFKKLYAYSLSHFQVITPVAVALLIIENLQITGLFFSYNLKEEWNAASIKYVPEFFQAFAIFPLLITRVSPLANIIITYILGCLVLIYYANLAVVVFWKSWDYKCILYKSFRLQCLLLTTVLSIPLEGMLLSVLPCYFDRLFYIQYATCPFKDSSIHSILVLIPIILLIFAHILSSYIFIDIMPYSKNKMARQRNSSLILSTLAKFFTVPLLYLKTSSTYFITGLMLLIYGIDSVYYISLSVKRSIFYNSIVDKGAFICKISVMWLIICKLLNIVLQSTTTMPLFMFIMISPLIDVATVFQYKSRPPLKPVVNFSNPVSASYQIIDQVYTIGEQIKNRDTMMLSKGYINIHIRHCKRSDCPVMQCKTTNSVDIVNEAQKIYNKPKILSLQILYIYQTAIKM